MNLKKKQKEFVIAAIGEGLETDEINARAAKCKPPFEVSRQQVDFYRKSRGVKLKEIAESDEFAALRSGLAIRNERIAQLEKLFTEIKKDLLENNLIWVKRKRALGSGEFMEIIDEQVLNTAQIKIYRDLLDDIAKETNQRTYAMRESLPEEEDASQVTVTVRYEEKAKQETEEGD